MLGIGVEKLLAVKEKENHVSFVATLLSASHFSP